MVRWLHEHGEARRRWIFGMLTVVSVLMLAAQVWATRKEASAREWSELSEARVTREEKGADASEGAVCRFSGPARMQLAPTSPGTQVEAWVDGEKVAETEVVGQGEESLYSLILDRRYAGKTVVFRFSAYPHLGEAGRATCVLGQEQALTLSAESHRGCGGG